jgi:hypothetical protein
MDKAIRNAIERATQQARKLLEEDFSSQLEGTFDVLRSGVVASKGGAHLSAAQQSQRGKILAAIEHKRAAGMTAAEAATDYVRDAAFTTLNRFVALKMLEARELVRECITKGEQSAGYREFCGMAPGVALLPDAAGYRLYIESLFDEFSTEIKVLFDRRDAASVLWPKRQTFEALLDILNATEFARVWGEDETIGWVYQFFNSKEERQAMRDPNQGGSQAPRNSRELAVRNQFFTPRYVVQFLADNTLGRLWVEMHGETTRLNTICEYLVRSADESVQSRPWKDPRDLRILDPACGSGHFLLYAFDLLLAIYEEAWSAEGTAPTSETTGQTLRADYPDLSDLRRAMPRLIVEHNLHGVDIDPRCAQIAPLALWLRAQRAWKDLGIAASERPRIHRTHIVLAEPMPGDERLVDEFAARLDPPLLRDLFKKMIDESRLAGEMGVLLRVEDGIAAELRRAREQFVKQRHSTGFLPGMESLPKQGALDLSGIDDDGFFHEAETRIVEALRNFAETADGGASVRRRLFAGDAAQGIALIDLLRTRFDVVLMNPPFGDATQAAAKYLERHYFDTRVDLFAAFSARLLSLSNPRGLIGAITPRDGFFKKTLGGWRELVLQNHMTVVADLGIGVLDSATVRVAAYVIEHEISDNPTRFIDVVDLPEREDRLRGEIKTPQRVYDVRLSSFRLLPLSRFLYWLPARLWELFTTADPLENDACTPRYGLTTLGDERFCRLSYEVESTVIGPSRVWAFMSKGGDEYPYGGISNCLVKWEHNGAEMAEVNRQSNGQIAQTRRASKYYFRPAVTFSNRSVQFSVRWHPANFSFSMRGPAIIPLKASQAFLLGFFNSRLVRALVQMQTASQTYTTGVLKELRWIEPDENSRRIVESAANQAFEHVRRRLATVETDPFFEGLLTSNDGPVPTTVSTYFQWRRRFSEDLNDTLKSLQSIIDHAVSRIYGVSLEDIERCERAEETSESGLDFPPIFAFPTSHAEALVSYLYGRAIGRWRDHRADQVPMLCDAAPSTAPASLPISEAVPIAVEDVGHPLDIVSLIRAELENTLVDTSDSDISALEQALGSNLRDWIARTFFERHLAAYTSYGRRAPVYWQIATTSSGYSVWLYLHGLSRDTIYKVQNDFVAPKLAHEERKLIEMRTDLGASPGPAMRKRLTLQEDFVEELRAFFEEIKLVAPLWTPNLDDGVIINFAPLWRLVPHQNAWQKELKTTWDSLCRGDHDWSHLAMRLWPERVVPKCATDRSLAIAHGLEDVFWVEGDNEKWKPRPVPTRPLDELVRERASNAVKAALKNLLEAHAANGNGGRARGRRVANAVADGGAR